jgi:hypothetical protein
MRLFLSIAALFASVLASADDSYTIKPAKFVAKGKSVKVTDKMTLTSVAKVTDKDNKLLNEDKSVKTSLEIFTEKTLAVDEKSSKRTKFSRTYEKAREVENDESETKPYQGRTILFVKSDGKWKLTAEGKPDLGDNDLDDLADEVNNSSGKSEEALYPKKAVKVGEKWTLSGKEIAEFFKELSMDPDSVKGEGKLLKAYKKDGQQWGTIEFVITFKSAFGELKKGSGELRATIDESIDGSTTAGKATIKITMSGKQMVEKDGKNLNVDLKVEMTINGDRVDVKEK